MQGIVPYLTTAVRTQDVITRVPPFSRKIGYTKHRERHQKQVNVYWTSSRMEAELPSAEVG